jgi:hypothetical protein
MTCCRWSRFGQPDRADSPRNRVLVDLEFGEVSKFKWRRNVLPVCIQKDKCLCPPSYVSALSGHASELGVLDVEFNLGIGMCAVCF